jgi:mannose-6-phosphate isomerase-like protein (cupin superfamily)
MNTALQYDNILNRLEKVSKIIQQADEGKNPVFIVGDHTIVTKLYEDSKRGVYISEAKGDEETDWHFHPQEVEIFIVEKGFLRVMFRENGVEIEKVVNPGEAIVVNANVEHSVFLKGGTILTIFTYPPLEEFTINAQRYK